ncbi:MAG: hypothetical protein IPL79_02420 [Myxococcales bacterium]|nr:hypothetical protein [Myxococcales bacterium]
MQPIQGTFPTRPRSSVRLAVLGVFAVGSMLGGCARPDFCAAMAQGNFKEATEALGGDMSQAGSDAEAVEGVVAATEAQSCVANFEVDPAILDSEPGIQVMSFEAQIAGARRACTVGLTLASPYRFRVHCDMSKALSAPAPSMPQAEAP